MCLICNHSLHILYNLSPWRPGGWATAVSWVISIIVGLSAVLLALLVVLWESQMQLRFLWCGRSWSWDSVPKAIQMLLLQCVSLVRIHINIYTLTVLKAQSTFSTFLKNLMFVSKAHFPYLTHHPEFLYHNIPNIPNVSFTHPHSSSSVLVAGRQWHTFQQWQWTGLEPLSQMDLELFKGASGFAVMPHRQPSLPGYKL